LSSFDEDSSSEKQKDKCSETKTYYDIQNIQKLLKSMTELKPYLFSKMTKEEKELAIAAYKNPIVARGYKTTTSTDTSSDEESNFFSDLGE
jgi:hypothetical protein